MKQVMINQQRLPVYLWAIGFHTPIFIISQIAFKLCIRLLIRQPLLQVDAFATARDGEIHEATRRILSVLLRQVKLDFPVVLVTNENEPLSKPVKNINFCLF